MSKSQTFSLNKHINQSLAAERKRKGLTQAQIAKKLRKPQSFVSKYENGQRQLSAADLVAVCKAMGIKPSSFIDTIE